MSSPTKSPSLEDQIAVLETSGLLALVVDVVGRIVRISEEAASALALPPQLFQGMLVTDLVRVSHREKLAALLQPGKPSSGRVLLPLIAEQGSIRWYEMSSKLLWTDTAVHRVLIGFEVTSWVDIESNLREQSHRDQLTGLANRAMLRQEISEAAELAMQKGHSFTVAFLDLDGFKHINDSLGHDNGDLLLQQVGARLRDAVHPDDVVARTGGDEFALLLRGVQTEYAAQRVAERLVKEVAKPYVLGDAVHRVTTSLGMARFSKDTPRGEALLKQADLAMYSAKNQGKNQYCVFNHKLPRKQNPFELEQKMVNGIMLEEFTLRYQPIFRPKTKEIVGAEALLRWTLADGSSISPEEFVPAAEKNGFIHTLGRWALRTACSQVTEWDASGISLRYVSVNVSPVQFSSPSFVEDVEIALRESKLEPSRLVLEITESALIIDTERAESILQRLAALGVRAAIDDFGTGYSSLSYLRRFPFAALKIDRSFVTDMMSSPKGQALVKSIITMSRELNLLVVAEGVETQDQCDLLVSHQCTFAQGWLVSRALDAVDFKEQVDTGALTMA